MKKKILCIIFVIICIIDIAITAIKGLNVGLYFGEGYNISFSESNINLKDIKSIAKDVFGNKFVVQKVEFFDNSCIIKVKSVNDDQINNLCTKLNEKYSSDLKSTDVKVEHISNVRVRNIVEPYIIPTILSLLIVLGYYAIRFKGASQMFGLVKTLLIVDVLIYSVYAIGRLPINVLTMPILIITYVLVVLGYTVYSEKQKESSK
jgi:preprotein translocase subunit SecF